MTTSTDLPGIASLGFGCAQLFRLHSATAREAVLNAAYDAGIRHFDVAPLYGLGLAEAELGRVLGSRRDTVTITTKYGLDPAAGVSLLRYVQGMARRLLGAVPPVKRYLQQRRRPLARSQSFDAKAAGRSLERSLRLLRIDVLDYFLLHEPTVELVERDQPMEFLLQQRDRGRIRAFGVAGPVEAVVSVVDRFPALASVIQHPAPPLGSPPVDWSRYAAVTGFVYGSISPRVAQVRAQIAASAVDRDAWVARFGKHEEGWQQGLARILLLEQRLAAPTSTILFGSTSPGHIREIIRAPSSQDLETVAWLRAWAGKQAGEAE